jgi:hypothetical protein
MSFEAPDRAVVVVVVALVDVVTEIGVNAVVVVVVQGTDWSSR